MDAQRLHELLEDFRSGRLTADEVVAEVSAPSFEDIGFAKVDHHRAIRKGFPEVVFGMGKTPEQVGRLAEVLLERSDRLLVTKTTLEAYQAACEVAPDAVFDELSRTITVDRSERGESTPGVVVASAGTSDLPVAAEAAVTAEIMGCRVERVNDVGVAGIHRLFAGDADDRRGEGCRRGCGNGRRACVGGRRTGSRAGHCCAYERRLRVELRRAGGASCDAEQLRAGGVGGEHRQRVRRWVYGGDDRVGF